VFKALASKVPLLATLRRSLLTKPPSGPSGQEIISKYLKTLPPGADLKIVFGGHWSNNPGWLLLNERDQDITQPLAFPSGIVDVVFAEHVIEHVPFAGGVQFLQESFRILKPGGVCRILCPMLDRLMTANLDDSNGREYVRNSLSPHFSEEQALLRDVLGIGGLDADPLAFLFNGIYLNHGHRFIWTSGLMIKVMKAIGFQRVERFEPGEGSRPADCIERRRRGIYLGYDWREELLTPHTVYDVESFVVEGVKASTHSAGSARSASSTASTSCSLL
jgi:SAM-dependent methyltransferase